MMTVTQPAGQQHPPAPTCRTRPYAITSHQSIPDRTHLPLSQARSPASRNRDVTARGADNLIEAHGMQQRQLHKLKPHDAMHSKY
jgi:hypothetical protein